MAAPSREDTRPVWLYVIFRKNHCSGHEKTTLNVSSDGPVFWDRLVAYVYCCSCHYDTHEVDLLSILSRFELRISRLCLVDTPLDYPFLPDSLFAHIARHIPNLEFVYIRELDLEHIGRATVAALAAHKRLKKLIVHRCRNFDALQDFGALPQLLVVRGEIAGLKAMLGDLEPPPSGLTSVRATSADDSESTVSSSTSSPPDSLPARQQQQQQQPLSTAVAASLAKH